MNNSDELRALINKYAGMCAKVYSRSTAGDYTWVGILASFLNEARGLDGYPFPGDAYSPQDSKGE